MSFSINKNCLIFDFGPLAGISLHSLWLRERVSGDEFVDPSSLQRLYEPSLIDEDIYIKEFSTAVF